MPCTNYTHTSVPLINQGSHRKENYDSHAGNQKGEKKNEPAMTY